MCNTSCSSSRAASAGLFARRVPARQGIAAAQGPTIAVVAAEPSGDLLGAGLIRELQRRRPGIRVRGVGGPAMEQAGCQCLFHMTDISLLGFEELLHKAAGILRIRRRLAKEFLNDPPQVFVGVDAPDFNLNLERRLRRAGIPTVHYVSPTVWAWRSYRVRKIRRAVSRMLTLFPFEAEFYRRHDVPVSFVGHPMADEIPEQVDKHACRRRLQLAADGSTLIGLLPGSRASELRRHGELFAATAAWLHKQGIEATYIAAFVDDGSAQSFARARAGVPDAPPVHTVVGAARDVIGASDVLLLASGTASLEAALMRRPMVVTYRLNRLSYWLIRTLSHVDLFAMPNLLAGREVVPEYIQDAATPQALGRALVEFLEDAQRVQQVEEHFGALYRTLRRNADRRAADAVEALIRA